MEVKKSPSADLENKKGLFLEIGLTLSLLLIIVMFGWSQKEKTVVSFAPPPVVYEEEMIDITTQEEEQVRPPVRAITAAADILEIVQDDAVIDVPMDFSQDWTDEVVEIIQPKVVEEEVAPENVPMIRVEVMPTFQGGDLLKFRDWVQSNVVYPKLAEENGISGTVFIQFVINTAGELVDAVVTVSPDKMLSDAALRTVMASPKWTAGMQRNRPQAVSMSIPVEFVLR